MRVSLDLRFRGQNETVVPTGQHMEGEVDAGIIDFNSSNNKTRDKIISRVLERKTFRKIEEEGRAELQDQPWEF